MLRLMNATCLLVVLFTIGGTAAAQGQTNSDKFYGLLHTAEDILAGRNLEKAQASVHPEASLVSGTSMASLLAVLKGETQSITLADSSYHGIMVQGRTNEREDMGFFMLKTRKGSDTTKVRFHSIVFLKDTTGEYRILHWQAGE